MSNPFQSVFSLQSLTDDLLSSQANQPNNLIAPDFNLFNSQFGAISEGDVVIIAGRPAMGKTQFAVNLTTHLCARHACLYISLDLSPKTITSRFIACKTGIESSKLLRKTLNDQERQHIQKAQKSIDESNLWISAQAHHTIASILAMIQAQVDENHVKFVVIDDLQKIIHGKTKSKLNAQSAELLQALKEMAKALQIAIVLLSQLSREVEKRTLPIPQLSDFFLQGSTLAFVDQVWFLYRPTYYGIENLDDTDSEGQGAKLIIAKNNSGSEGILDFKIDKYFTSFTVLDDQFS
jgi:replicative DNA helicase